MKELKSICARCGADPAITRIGTTQRWLCAECSLACYDAAALRRVAAAVSNRRELYHPDNLTPVSYDTSVDTVVAYMHQLKSARSLSVIYATQDAYKRLTGLRSGSGTYLPAIYDIYTPSWTTQGSFAAYVAITATPIMDEQWSPEARAAYATAFTLTWRTNNKVILSIRQPIEYANLELYF